MSFWCEMLTFMEAKYTDPKTGLRYYNKEIYQLIQTLTHERIQSYLDVRNAAVQLR